MKKIILIILTFFAFFSIVNFSFALNDSRGYIDKLLDFPYGVEEYKLIVKDIDYVYFTNPDSQRLYDSFRNADNLLKNELIRLYKANEIEYYRMNGIVDEYNMFVYHTNKMFSYISIKGYKNDKQLDTIILNNYTLSRQYHDRVKHLINSKQKNQTN